MVIFHFLGLCIGHINRTAFVVETLSGHTVRLPNHHRRSTIHRQILHRRLLLQLLPHLHHPRLHPLPHHRFLLNLLKEYNMSDSGETGTGL